MDKDLEGRKVYKKTEPTINNRNSDKVTSLSDLKLML